MDTQQIRSIITNYLLYLDDGGERIRLSQTERIHYPGFVHASNLLDCPLKSRKERNNEQAVFPELLKQNNPTLLLRMLEGERIAEIIQEAFSMASHLPLEYFVSEYSVYSNELFLQGRIDITYFQDDIVNTIIEIKHRLPTWKNKVPEPRMGDVFQMLAYKMMTGAEEAHLIIVDTPAYRDFNDPTKGYSIWTLYQDAEYPEGCYILQDENLEPWWDSFNHGGYINETNLKAEVNRQLAYLNGKNDIPIDLDSNEAWQCKSNVKLAKDGVGIIEARCPYWCHSNPSSLQMEYYYDEQGMFQLVKGDEF